MNKVELNKDMRLSPHFTIGEPKNNRRKILFDCR